MGDMLGTMNWKALIEDLLKTGMTQNEIAVLVGCRQGYVSDVLNGRRGKSLSYEIGSRLIALHADRAPKAA